MNPTENPHREVSNLEILRGPSEESSKSNQSLCKVIACRRVRRESSGQEDNERLKSLSFKREAPRCT